MSARGPARALPPALRAWTSELRQRRVSGRPSGARALEPLGGTRHTYWPFGPLSSPSKATRWLTQQPCCPLAGRPAGEGAPLCLRRGRGRLLYWGEGVLPWRGSPRGRASWEWGAETLSAVTGLPHALFPGHYRTALSSRVAPQGHIGRRAVWGHTYNTLTLMKADRLLIK